jgi:hypothetical protein
MQLSNEMLANEVRSAAADLEAQLAIDLDRLLDLVADGAGDTLRARQLRARIVASHERFEELVGLPARGSCAAVSSEVN